jgi:hypothetical protein
MISRARGETLLHDGPVANLAGATHRCKWCGGDVPVSAGPCPLSFRCPTCGAEPGVWCKRPSEHKAQELHSERVDLEHADKERRFSSEVAATSLTLF